MQLNRSLFLALMAQFQSFARDLHDEAVSVHVDAAAPGQGELIRSLLTRGRKLDTGNPSPSSLGSDYGRLGLVLLDDLKQHDPRNVARLVALRRLVEFRNAIAHGQEAKIESLEEEGSIRSTKRSYRSHRGYLDRLADTMDEVVGRQLASLLHISAPW